MPYAVNPFQLMREEDIHLVQLALEDYLDLYDEADESTAAIQASLKELIGLAEAEWTKQIDEEWERKSP